MWFSKFKKKNNESRVGLLIDVKSKKKYCKEYLEQYRKRNKDSIPFLNLGYEKDINNKNIICVIVVGMFETKKAANNVSRDKVFPNLDSKNKEVIERTIVEINDSRFQDAVGGPAFHLHLRVPLNKLYEIIQRENEMENANKPSVKLKNL